MTKFLKPGKVVVVISGRFAGCKAVIVRNYDDGTSDRPYGHALVAGVSRYPRKVTRDMSEKLVEKRSRLKPFVKVINYSHLMPTRYALDLAEELKKRVPAAECVGGASAAESAKARLRARSRVKQLFQERYMAGKNRWFFTKLRF